MVYDTSSEKYIQNKSFPLMIDENKLSSLAKHFDKNHIRNINHHKAKYSEHKNIDKVLAILMLKVNHHN